MRPSSAQFARAITEPHRMATQVRARFGSGLWVDVPVESGTVTMDRTRLVRRSLDLTVVGREWARQFDSPGWQLSPYGGQISVRRGIGWPDGSIELMDLGLFVIQRAMPERGQVQVTGMDLYSRLVDDRFEEPRKPAAGASIVAVLTSLIQETIPGVTVHVDDRVVDRSYAGRSTWEEKRDEAVRDLATSLGCDIFADATGGFTLRPVPSLYDAPQITLAQGPGGVLVKSTGEQTREGVYNAVVARSDPADPDAPIIRVVARDDDPASITYYWGPFGKKPRFYTSPLLTSTEQAEGAARAILSGAIGTHYAIDFSGVPDPRIEVGDVVRLGQEGSEPATPHVVDQLAISLTAQSDMTGSSRCAHPLEDE